MGAKAYILQRSGDNEQALIAAEKALYRGDISLTSEWRGMTLIAKAGAQNSLGSYEDAVETAREAVRFAPESSTIWVVQANALAHLGRETESQAAAQQGLANVEVQIADDPERVECWENKSALLRCLGRTDDAEAAEAQVHEVLSRMTSTSRSDAL
jgi:tetratricopeptide (TPR) repeat protein